MSDIRQLRRLQPFENTDVLTASMVIPGAGGGLREPLAADPVEWHLDDIVDVVLHLRVAKVRFEPIKDTDALSRVHVMEVLGATTVDADLVADKLEQQAKRVAAAKRERDAAEGRPQLPLDGDGS